ncbi:hypothetical protein Fcan01_26402 [Folsomia candida]|uniref:Uncharacterized protein n=1 Tax=Folsomia candida TaxID=158441 RepID=A0A226D3A2_FOLCA|nr:hypothetical protein Fcan01_26402 [Folsomia candida]
MYSSDAYGRTGRANQITRCTFGPPGGWHLRIILICVSTNLMLYEGVFWCTNGAATATYVLSSSFFDARRCGDDDDAEVPSPSLHVSLPSNEVTQPWGSPPPRTLKITCCKYPRMISLTILRRLKPSALPSRFFVSQEQLLTASTPSEIIRPSPSIKFIPILPKEVTSIAVSPPSLDVSQSEISGSFESPCSPSSSVSSPRPQSNISSPETSPSSTTDNKKRIRQLQQKLRPPRVKVFLFHRVFSLTQPLFNVFKCNF